MRVSAPRIGLPDNLRVPAAPAPTSSSVADSEEPPMTEQAAATSPSPPLTEDLVKGLSHLLSHILDKSGELDLPAIEQELEASVSPPHSPSALVARAKYLSSLSDAYLRIAYGLQPVGSSSENPFERTETTGEVEHIEFEVGDHVIYPHHGAGKVISKGNIRTDDKTREYLTIKILHNDMTVKVASDDAVLAGLRRVIDKQTVEKVLNLLQGKASMTGDIYELAEVVRSLSLRESKQGSLSTGETQMLTRAKKILASELMYALDKNLDESEALLDRVLSKAEMTSAFTLETDH
jgi:CarD family transcriptional regulator